MKSLVLLAFLALLLVLVECARENRELTSEEKYRIRKRCLNNPDIDVVLRAQIHKRNYPNKMPAKCFVKCFLEGVGLYAEPTGFNYDLYREYLSDAFPLVKINEGISQCQQEYQNLKIPCNIAYHVYKCLVYKGLSKTKPTFHPHKNY